MRINIDTTDPRWSPTQRMILEQVKDKLQQEPRRPTDQGGGKRRRAIRSKARNEGRGALMIPTQ